LPLEGVPLTRERERGKPRSVPYAKEREGEGNVNGEEGGASLITGRKGWGKYRLRWGGRWPEASGKNHP